MREYHIFISKYCDIMIHKKFSAIVFVKQCFSFVLSERGEPGGEREGRFH